MKRQYPAIIAKDSNGGYDVSFPDFSQCAGAGTTPEEAIAIAALTLDGCISELRDSGASLPEPTPLEAVTAKTGHGMACVTLVPITLPGRARRINVSLDENLVAEIDALTSNRSRFLAEAARAELSRRT